MYKAIVCYEGTFYFGWQKTITGPSIQEELEKALFKITGELTTPEAASRTDRGVHARGQVVQFSLQKALEPKVLQRGLNGILPKDIRVLDCSFEDFHPTLDALGKEYHYHFSVDDVQDPTQRFFAWHCYFPLDREKMIQAAQQFTGKHDFSPFSTEKKENPYCTIESIVVEKECIKIKGDRFLYKMARALAGTIIYYGTGKVTKIDHILTSKDRKEAGITAPAHGLYLHKVFYDRK